MAFTHEEWSLEKVLRVGVGRRKSPDAYTTRVPGKWLDEYVEAHMNGTAKVRSSRACPRFRLEIHARRTNDVAGLLEAGWR